jgi:hypothetical protein
VLLYDVLFKCQNPKKILQDIDGMTRYGIAIFLSYGNKELPDSFWEGFRDETNSITILFATRQRSSDDRNM